MSEFLSYRVDDGHGLPHNPLKALVAPRPIGWISTRAASGVLNLAPYSFFNMLCDAPPLIAFSSGGGKDSLTNCQDTGEFVWNMVDEPLREHMNATSATLAPDIDEFTVAAVTPAAGIIVNVPRVSESPAALECRVTQIIRLTDLNGTQTNQWLTVGQILAVHIRADLIKDGYFNTGAARPILRAGYAADYAVIDPAAIFQMDRPNTV